jgi:hypothetical protein
LLSVSRLPALQRKQSACRLVMASEPPWFHRCAEGCAYGDDVVHLQGPLVRDLLSNSHAPQHSQRPLARVSTLYFTEPLIGVRWRLRCPKPQAFA